MHTHSYKRFDVETRNTAVGQSKNKIKIMDRDKRIKENLNDGETVKTPVHLMV